MKEDVNPDALKSAPNKNAKNVKVVEPTKRSSMMKKMMMMLLKMILMMTMKITLTMHL